MNIAVQNMLTRLESEPMVSPTAFRSAASSPTAMKRLQEYDIALKGRPVRKTRQLVNACRASGSRRQEFKDVIIRGNTTQYWGSNGLPVLSLLRDCETRWSSTYIMLERSIKLHPVSEKVAYRLRFKQFVQATKSFMSYPQNTDIAHFLLTPDEHQVTKDICKILEVPHAAQELLSAEKTPTLSMALPVYETMVSTWRKFQRAFPELQDYIAIGISKIEEYSNRSRKSRAYALSMSKSLLIQ